MGAVLGLMVEPNHVCINMIVDQNSRGFESQSVQYSDTV